MKGTGSLDRIYVLTTMDTGISTVGLDKNRYWASSIYWIRVEFLYATQILRIFLY